MRFPNSPGLLLPRTLTGTIMRSSRKMPSRHRFRVPVALESLVASFPLRISAIANLEPGAGFSV
jgi:hypothetical protein